MNQCDGQMNLMDLLVAPVTSEPPILLTEGQKVYKVIRGDIETHIVTGETWTCEEGNRGYRLKRIGGCWDCTWNTQLDRVVFTERVPAERVAEQYLLEHEHILGKDIRATKVVAYRHLYFDREVINFYAVLESGDVYFQYGSMYHHIGKEDEIEKFEDVRHTHVKSDGYMELENYQPEYANMCMVKMPLRSWTSRNAFVIECHISISFKSCFFSVPVIPAVRPQEQSVNS